jgi:hypothetical protein
MLCVLLSSLCCRGSCEADRHDAGESDFDSVLQYVWPNVSVDTQPSPFTTIFCLLVTASRVGWYCLMCYLACLVPFTAVSRAAFLYHYMPALLYGEFLIGMKHPVLCWRCCRAFTRIRAVETARDIFDDACSTTVANASRGCYLFGCVRDIPVLCTLGVWFTPVQR